MVVDDDAVVVAAVNAAAFGEAFREVPGNKSEEGVFDFLSPVLLLFTFNGVDDDAGLIGRGVVVDEGLGMLLLLLLLLVLLPPPPNEEFATAGAGSGNFGGKEAEGAAAVVDFVGDA